MATYQVISLIIFLTAVFAYVNDRFIKLPATIGIMILALLSSLLLVVIGKLVPSVSAQAVVMVSGISFEQVLLKVMLSFLLFAGSLHINAQQLKRQFWPVIILATFGTLISTFAVSIIAYYLFQLFGMAVPYVYCLLFGALISPTDPISVMGILKKAGIPQTLELKIAGESLFNDGIGVVIFLTILEAANTGMDKFSVGGTVILFLKEAGGGVIFGAVLGYVAYYFIKSIDNYRVEVLITLTVVMSGYGLADQLHLSAPLAVIIAGIIIGTKGRGAGLSAISRDYLGKFWDLLDEIFNAVLFLLIGLEMLVIKVNATITIIGLMMIAVVLLARYFCVFFPVAVMKIWMKFERNAVLILTWGGLRGGLSVAMALSLPENMHRDEFVLITYIVVVFSIIVQGLSIGKVAARLK